VILVAASDVLEALKSRVADHSLELLAFSDGDALLAIEAIVTRRPRIVALERRFAATPRGTALIERISVDPSLSGCEIRLISQEGGYSPTSERRPPTVGTDHVAPESTASPASAQAAVAAPAGRGALDRRGTRRATRYRMGANVDVLVDGNAALLVDLSTIGAQVVTLTVLKPNQRVRMALPDDVGTIRFNALVAWASFEIVPNVGPRYRAGVEFVDADPTAVSAYCLRHR
jgi:hypothetical protein